MSRTFTFGIIGFGRFGQLWAECLKPFGEVKIFDKKSAVKGPWKDFSFVSLREVVKCDLLFLLVPISEMENICKKISAFLQPNTLVIDACSVKIAPVKAMGKWLPKGHYIIATHPLFGPDSVKRMGLKNQKIVVCNVSARKKELQSFEKILKKLKLKIIHSTPEQHDLQMAKSQALVHFIGRSLNPLNLQPQAISTPDYHTLLRMNDMVQNDTWQLFFDMQNYNPYTKKIRKTFLNSLQKLDREVLAKGGQAELKHAPQRPLRGLSGLRLIINELDDILIQTVARRMAVSRTIGGIKKDQKLAVKDPKREKLLAALHKKLATKHGITYKTLQKIFALIMEESKRIQK